MPFSGTDRHRSRSPRDDGRRQRTRTRSPQPHRHGRHSRGSSHRGHKPSDVRVQLPFQARPIGKHDLEIYKPMFALYLDIQKRLVIEDLPEEEIKGRWKSFLGKWNRGELAEGWYDPATLQKARTSAADISEKPSREPNQPSGRRDDVVRDGSEDPSDDDVVGPALPEKGKESYKQGPRSGPSIPNVHDLELKREHEEEASAARREDLRFERKLDRKTQKEQLEELVPRAEAGSKDRMLEKKREKADSNRAFAAGKADPGAMEEVTESDLFGGEGGGLEGYKKQKKELERKKNERELRKEEILRARREEREERIQDYRAKEERTMSGLIALARAKFG